MAYVIGDDCVACGSCIGECPAGAISEGEKYVIDPDACIAAHVLTFVRRALLHRANNIVT